MAEAQIRRNIHTYPFKYQHLEADAFFARERAVIYIHIPFCNTKCHFCDYVVYVNTTRDLRAAYVDALCKEITTFKNNRTFPGFEIVAVSFGGGTPGLLEAEQLARILDTLRASFPLSEDCEVAVEFDPASVTLDKLARIKDAGYNRVSIGVQS